MFFQLLITSQKKLTKAFFKKFVKKFFFTDFQKEKFFLQKKLATFYRIRGKNVPPLLSNVK